MELIPQSVVICSFQHIERTSEIEFAFLEWIQIREGVLDELSSEAHGALEEV